MTDGPRIDLGPAADEVRRLAATVVDEEMALPTPCDGINVGDLLSHIVGLSIAFRDAAAKSTTGTNAGPPPRASAGDLPPEWRQHLPVRLDELVAAWRQPEAWEGETTAGGVTMPAAQMGVVALDELVLHGWDLARALDQPFSIDPAHAEAVLGFTTAVAEAGAEARQGLFGPPIPVPADAPVFDRALGLAGRDPAWRARR